MAYLSYSESVATKFEFVSHLRRGIIPRQGQVDSDKGSRKDADPEDLSAVLAVSCGIPLRAPKLGRKKKA